MDEIQFWQLIEAGGPYSPDAQSRQLASVRRQLKKQSASAVFVFYRLFCERMIEAQTWSLWAAAHVINGHCSEDGFVSFRAWLIAQGRTVFAAALENADSVADTVRPGLGEYGFDSLFRLPRKVHFDLCQDDVPRLGLVWGAELSGEHWEIADRLERCRRLPRLTALFRRNG